MLPVAPDPPPALDPVVIADDELLGMAVDAVVYADLDARARMLEIARYAEALRASLDAEMWATFMRYDELANGRFAELLLVIARWAFDGGQKHPMESPS
jgi:hypothetical protein